MGVESVEVCNSSGMFEVGEPKRKAVAIIFIGLKGKESRGTPFESPDFVVV